MIGKHAVNAAGSSWTQRQCRILPEGWIGRRDIAGFKSESVDLSKEANIDGEVIVMGERDRSDFGAYCIVLGQ